MPSLSRPTLYRLTRLPPPLDHGRALAALSRLLDRLARRGARGGQGTGERG
jgi:hypothetical protein